MSEQAYTQTVEQTLTVSGANTASWYPGRPWKVVRWGYVVTTAITTDEPVELSMNKVEADGTACDPTGAAEGGTVTSVNATQAVNTGAYLEAENFVNSRPLFVVPGERLDIVSDGNPTVGVARVWVEYLPLPFVDTPLERNDATIPGAAQRATSLAALTEVTS